MTAHCSMDSCKISVVNEPHLNTQCTWTNHILKTCHKIRTTANVMLWLQCGRTVKQVTGTFLINQNFKPIITLINWRVPQNKTQPHARTDTQHKSKPSALSMQCNHSLTFRKLHSVFKGMADEWQTPNESSKAFLFLFFSHQLLS